jgi:hypothetical protein
MGDPPHLGRWLWALRIALLLATIGAVLLARRRREYTPIAGFLSWIALCHIVRPVILVFVLLPADEAGRLPFTGAERAAFHVEQALFVSWPLGIAALAVWILARRRPWPIAVAYAAVVLGLILGYPTVRRELLQSVYLGVTLAALAVSIGAAASWWRTKAQPMPPEIASLLFIAVEVGAILGPFAAGMIDKTWPVAQGLYFGLYAMLFALEVAWSRRP